MRRLVLMPKEILQMLSDSAYDVVLEQFPFYKCVPTPSSSDIFHSLAMFAASLTCQQRHC
jgi:hypothetical protein